ncbi:MAG: Gfo/Idh/MocA family oxidoreductase [Alphaproteobacteria bacterium]|nr:Gfo/Idh/MocA family oxidoreductase [Alphaproteobacteria bacterium]
MKPVKWGVLSTAAIGVNFVIPAMRKQPTCDVVAIASRDREKSEEIAGALGIAKAYGSYEALLADPEIEAIYNPLPNHLHVPWSIKAAEAGKHVLCEKPIGLDATEAETLLEARDRCGVLIQEAIMVRTHPQWLRVREIVRQGGFGGLQSIRSVLSYHILDPKNVRNRADIGGGGIYDIGFYPVTTSRFVFEKEPERVVALVEWDPVMKIDRLTSAILDFPGGQASFICGTQMVTYQRCEIFCSAARIEVTDPFGAPNNRPCRIVIDRGGDLFAGTTNYTEEAIDTIDQYGLQGELFSQAIRGAIPQPIPLEDAVANMRVIDALYRSARSGRWEPVG